MGIQILSMESGKHTKPDFTRKPELKRIDNPVGISELCSHLKGGLSSGIAKERFKEDVFEIYVYLLGIFENTKFYTLYPGDLKKTTDMILDQLR
jgi:hypothetical protein